MPESIAPAFVKLEYISAAGPHVMIVPTRAWSPPAGGFTFGSFPRWSDDTARDADDMILDLVAEIVGLLSTTSSFNRYTIFTQDSPTADPQPRISKAFTDLGEDISGSWEVAVQRTINMRTEGFGIAKIVILDSPSLDSFVKVVSPGVNVAVDQIVAVFSDVLNAWSGRDNTRPVTFISQTITLNEKLRRAYRLT